jgi:hypothetical protein
MTQSNRKKRSSKEFDDITIHKTHLQKAIILFYFFDNQSKNEKK